MHSDRRTPKSTTGRPQRMHKRKGATVIEFALTFLLLLTLVVGVFELGRTIWTYNALTHAAKQASRYAMVHGSKNPLGQGDKTVETYAKEQVIGVPSGQIAVNVTTDPNNEPGSKVTVTVATTMNYVVAPLLGLGKTIRMRGKSVKTIVN